MRHLVDF